MSDMMRLVRRVFALRWLLVLSCVTCAVIERNEATNTLPYLVYTSGPVIYRVSVNGSSSNTVLDSTAQQTPNKLGIDFDYNHGRLFWVDSSRLRIMSSNLDGSDVETIMSSSSDFLTLERLAYDWVTEKIYWSDYAAARIGIVDIQSGNRMVLISTGEIRQSQPRALTLDPMRRNMYWVDWLQDNGAAVIERASMDGQDRRVIVNSALSEPYDITIDISTDTLYFADGYLGKIYSVRTDGTERRIIHSFRGSVVPYSLVFHNRYLYWTDRVGRLISRLSLDGRVLENVTATNVRPAGLALIAEGRQQQFFNPCATSRCSHICILSSADARGYTCGCEEGIELASDGFRCRVMISVTPTTTTTTTLPPSSTTNILLLPSSISPSPTPSPHLGVCNMSSPCHNGGVCVNLEDDERGYKCECQEGFIGDNCTEPLGICNLPTIEEPLCHNGATCVNTGVYEYRCVCLSGFKGRYCETRINYGVCNMSSPCHNGGVCVNLEDDERGYECECQEGFIGDVCNLTEPQGSTPGVTPVAFVGVVAGFLMLVGVLVLIIICAFAMLRRQKEKTKELETGSRSNSPMIKKRVSQYRTEQTPSSTDTASRDSWRFSQPSVVHGHANIYTQPPRRGVPPNLSKYAKTKSYDELSRESKILTV